MTIRKLRKDYGSEKTQDSFATIFFADKDGFEKFPDVQTYTFYCHSAKLRDLKFTLRADFPSDKFHSSSGTVLRSIRF